MAMGKTMYRASIMVIVVALGLACPAGVVPKGGNASAPPSRHVATVKSPKGYRPPPPKLLRYSGNDITIDLHAARFAQGTAVYAEIYRNPSGGEGGVTLKRFVFDGRSIPLSERRWGHRAVFGIHPETAPGVKRLRVEYAVDGAARVQNASLTVAATVYPFHRKPLDLGNYSNVEYSPSADEVAFIKRCAEKKARVFAHRGPDLLGGAVSHPRSMHFVTSPFWAKRTVMRYRIRKGRKIPAKNRVSVHRGTDLRGKTGEPVFAMAAGKVAIAEAMYYEGNFVVIDHGGSVFTYYMHLDDFAVREGDAVRAGDLIGRVGSSGLSTASHLHVSLRILDVYVEPLSLLSLPIRE